MLFRSLRAINRIERPAEILPGPRFHFHKNERVAIAADEVDLAALASTEVAVKNLESAATQMTRGQFLAPRPELQMPGARTRKPAAPPAQMSGGESGKGRVHGVSGDAAQCSSLCAD